MKEIIEKLKAEYEAKKSAYFSAAKILEKVNEEMFLECLKKAAGCKLMIEEYERQLIDLK
ncbi:MAG: hypothetical protein WC886_08750 [Saccharofermentanaceae bacterium]|jgi:hypothetical protein